MKVGIMTWWHWDNFGTVLQAFALNKYLNDVLNIEAETIKWLPDYSVGEKTIKDQIKSFLLKEKAPKESKRNLRQSNELFESFREKIKFSDILSDIEFRNHIKKYDCVIYGSDQIWQPWFYKREYWGDFVNMRRIAYAPSVGNASDFLEYPRWKKLIRKMKRFDALSFRETETADFFGKLLNKECETVVDPVMLLEWSDWKKHFSEKTYISDKKSMLIYLLDKEDREKKIKYAVSLAQKESMIPIIIANNESEKGKKYVISDFGPAEFIRCINDCDAVFTDSFHGMVFSTLFHTPFVPLKRKMQEGKNAQNFRLYSFLELIGVQENLFSVMNMEQDHRCLNSWQWEMIDKKICEKRKLSKEYLCRVLR